MEPRRRSTGGQFAKRVMDFSLSFSLLVLLSPLLILIVILIRLDSPGSAFYRAERVGYQGRKFRIFKFRSMIPNPGTGPTSTAEDDPRITRTGRLLRKYKLDEIPQLINVLKGEMSLVGPRPQIPWAVDLYTQEQRLILTVRPGITDWASLRFRNEGHILRGSTDPDRDYLEKIAPEKTRLAMEYVRTQSLKTDLKILAETVRAVLSNEA